MAGENTLTYVFEADASGLTATLNSAVNQIKDLVSNMNTQSVDWQTILTGTLDPAIIAGIASSLAIGITQALQFQNYLQQISNTTPTATTAQQGGTSGIADQIDSISKETGIATTQMAQAWQTVTGQLGDATGQFLTLVATMAQQDNVPFLQTVQQLAPLMQNFGITTVPQVTDAMQGLQKALVTGNINDISTLISDIASAGPGLGLAGAKISDIAATLEGMTKVIPTTVVVSMLDSIGQAATNNLSNLNLLLGGSGSFNKIAADIKSSGLEGVYDDIFTHIKTGSTASSLAFGQAMGLNADQVTALRAITVPQMNQILASIQAVQTAGAQPLIPGSDKDLSDLQLMGKLWNDIKVTLQEIVQGTGLPDWFHTVLTDADELFSHPWDTLKSILTGGTGTLGGLASTVSSVGTTAATGGTAALVTGIASSIATAIGTEFTKLFGGGSAGGPIQSSNSASTVINNNYQVTPQSIGGSNGVSSMSQAMANGTYAGLYSYNKPLQ